MTLRANQIPSSATNCSAKVGFVFRNCASAPCPSERIAYVEAGGNFFDTADGHEPDEAVVKRGLTLSVISAPLLGISFGVWLIWHLFF
jgi:hypothetical protein